MRLFGRRFDTRGAVAVDIEGAAISAVTPLEAGRSGLALTHSRQSRGRDSSGQALTDNYGSLPWIAPGLVDVQVNGYNGRAFSHGGLSQQDVAEISTALDGAGVTSYCPTRTPWFTPTAINSPRKWR